jgi:hypothetical protein
MVVQDKIPGHGLSHKCPSITQGAVMDRKHSSTVYEVGKPIPVPWLLGAQLSALAILWFFVVSDKLMTKEYTVCSGGIYTVDEANPRVDCILVRGAIIHDTGSFGIRVHHAGYLPLMFI